MKETKFQKQVKKQLESQAAFIINVHGHGMQIAGLPDLQIIHKDWKGWLELKVEKGKASFIQRIQATKIELREVPVYVLRCVEGNELGVFYGNELQNTLTLENFEGVVIETFYDLKELLGVLVKLELNNGVKDKMDAFKKWWEKRRRKPYHSDVVATIEEAWRAALKWHQSIAEKCEKDCVTPKDYKILYFHLKQVLKNEVGE